MPPQKPACVCEIAVDKWMCTMGAYILLIDKVLCEQLLGRQSALHRSWLNDSERRDGAVTTRGLT